MLDCSILIYMQAIINGMTLDILIVLDLEREHCLTVGMVLASTTIRKSDGLSVKNNLRGGVKNRPFFCAHFYLIPHSPFG